MADCTATPNTVTLYFDRSQRTGSSILCKQGKYPLPFFEQELRDTRRFITVGSGLRRNCQAVGAHSRMGFVPRNKRYGARTAGSVRYLLASGACACCDAGDVQLAQPPEAVLTINKLTN